LFAAIVKRRVSFCRTAPCNANHRCRRVRLPRPQVITLLPGCAIAGPARPAHNAADPITAALASMTVESAGSGALRPAVRPPERGAKTAVLQTSYRCSELAPRNPPRP
jgi:hypothetical protein